MTGGGVRRDLAHILAMIGNGVTILDVGCGDGSLLELITSNRTNVRAAGIELTQAGVNACVKKGFSVFQGDADTDLESLPEYDWVILSHVIQSVRHPRHVLKRAVEIGKRAVVSFYNVAFWRNRIAFVLAGTLPPRPDQTRNDGDAIYRKCSIKDFADLCIDLGVVTEKRIVLGVSGQEVKSAAFHNLLGYQAIFVLSKRSAYDVGNGVPLDQFASNTLEYRSREARSL